MQEATPPQSSRCVIIVNLPLLSACLYLVHAFT